MNISTSAVFVLASLLQRLPVAFFGLSKPQAACFEPYFEGDESPPVPSKNIPLNAFESSIDVSPPTLNIFVRLGNRQP